MRSSTVNVLIVTGMSAGASAQTSELFITGADKTVSVVQNGSLKRQWTYQGDFAPNIAVTNTVKLFPREKGSTGQEFDLFGNPTGNTYANNLADFRYDGTTDGTYNYAIGLLQGDSNAKVVRFDSDWSNPVPLFIPELNEPNANWGITWDGSDNTFWIISGEGNQLDNFLYHRAMDGTNLGAINTGWAGIAGLAIDPADGTIWMTEYAGGDYLRQYDRNGTLLDRFLVEGLGEAQALSCEFAIPAPGATALLAVSAAGLVRRRR